MDKLYVIEECLAPGIWVLLSDRFYMTKSDAKDVCLKVCQSMQKFKKKGFKARDRSNFIVINRKNVLSAGNIPTDQFLTVSMNAV